MKKEVLIEALQKRQRKNKQQRFSDKVISIFINNWLRRTSFMEEYNKYVRSRKR